MLRKSRAKEIIAEVGNSNRFIVKIRHRKLGLAMVEQQGC